MSVKATFFFGLLAIWGNTFCQNINSGDRIKLYTSEAEISEARGEFELGCKMAKLANDYAEATNRSNEVNALKNRICLKRENELKREQEINSRYVQDNILKPRAEFMKKSCDRYGVQYRLARQQCAVASNIISCINTKMGFDAGYLIGCN